LTILSSDEVTLMSILMVVHNDKVAVIQSDGRISRRAVAGTVEVVKEDEPKFRVLREHRLVLGGTGREDIIFRVTAKIVEYISGKEDVAFEDLSCRVGEIAKSCFPEYADRENSTLSIVLIGYDEHRNLVRCISFIDEDGFLPFEREQGVYAFGPDGLAQPWCDRLTGLLQRHTGSFAPEVVWRAMDIVQREAAAQHPGVNTVPFRALIKVPEGDTAPSGV
jgi:hypothetical protein